MIRRHPRDPRRSDPMAHRAAPEARIEMAHPIGTPPPGHRRSRLLLAILVLAVAVVAVLPMAGAFGLGPLGATLTGPTPSAASPSPSAVPSAAIPAVTAEPRPAFADVPIVPVTQFRAAWDDAEPAEIAPILAGTSERYGAIELVAADADAIRAALAIGPTVDPARLVLAPDAATLRTDLATHRDRLAFLRLSDVDPSVRALAWHGTTAFGVGRASSVKSWPLSIHVEIRGPDEGLLTPGGSAAGYDPATAWTLVAAGDVLLDRGVADEVKNVQKDVDFPFDGGTAEITSRRCCSALGNPVPVSKRTGNAGTVRALFQGADLAITNFENPAPDAFKYHSEGTVFSADPALLKGVADAGIDWVSLANNHIRDFGAQGVLDTIANLDKWGIGHGGAGKDLAAARAPTMLTVGSTRVAILAYDTIAPSYAAGVDRAGSAQMSAEAVTTDVATARSLGAQLVIVFPHWGVEYTTGPTAQQQALGRAAIDAGADIVIGNHPHWAGAVEVYKGKPIFYALGNLIFDQTWSEPTLEGISLEMTFAGARLVQVHIRPHLILDRSQPNFLAAGGSGQVVMDQVFNASKKTLPW